MNDDEPSGSRSMVEARMLGSGQVTYVIRVVPGETTIEELESAIDLAQEALLYATTEEDEEEGET